MGRLHDVGLLAAASEELRNRAAERDEIQAALRRHFIVGGYARMPDARVKCHLVQARVALAMGRAIRTPAFQAAVKSALEQLGCRHVKCGGKQYYRGLWLRT